MESMTFKVGDKVKCIDNTRIEYHLKLNSIYIIEELKFRRTTKELVHIIVRGMTTPWRVERFVKYKERNLPSWF